jgi:hypothetical protein
MKNYFSNSGMLVTTLTFACILSCSEQDESPVAQNNLSGMANSIQPGKSRATGGRVGGITFNSEIGDPIDLETARQWAGNYRDKNPDGTRGHFFGSEIIQQILSESGCVGIRIYYAFDEKGEKKLLIVGVDGEGNNLLPLDGAALDGGGNTIADYSFPCPTYCGGEGDGF